MSVRRSLLVLALLTLLLPIAVFSIQGQQTNIQQTTSVNPDDLQPYTVTTGRVESVVSAIGSIKADQIVNLSFRVPGSVREVLVQTGDYMFAGEPLVQLDDTNQRIALDQASLTLDRAQIELDNLLSPVSEDDIRIAQANVDAAWGQYLSVENAVTPEDIRSAELAYEQAQEQQRIAEENAGLPSNNLPTAQAGAASFNTEIARLQLEDLRTANIPQLNAAYANVVVAQREFDRVQAGPSPFQIDAAALTVRQAESQLRRSEVNLNRTTLRAPIDGLISNVTTEVGGLVAPGVTVIEMTDTSPLRLTVQVDEIDVRFLSAGIPARITLDALPGVSISATIERVSLLGTNNEGIVSYDVDVTLGEVADPRVRVGMTAEASIVVESREDVLIVPNFYIRLNRLSGQAFVNVLRPDGTIDEVEVVLGLQGRDNSEITSGLVAGDVVVIDPNDERFDFFGG